MPIPIERLREMLDQTVDWRGPPPDWSEEAWMITAWDPGDTPEDPEGAAADLMRRLEQSGRRWVSVSAVRARGRIPGVATPDMDRAAAVKLGYKLGRWAVYRLHAGALQPVFTGINSRLQ